MIEDVFTTATCESGIQAISKILRRTPVRVFILAGEEATSLAIE